MSDVDNFLAHYGVKGMKWGVRRQARRDANETAKAKMYYGEGAGTRRKLIKNTVAERSKDPDYKKAFDEHMSKQDMAKRVDQARSKRRRTDAIKSTKKTARGLTHALAGNPMYASAAAIAIAGGIGIARRNGLDKLAVKYAKTGYSAAKTSLRAMQIRRQFKTAGW